MSKPNKDEIQTFSNMITEMSIKLESGILDTILIHCEESGLEIEVASTLLSNPLKSRIREEAESENLIKRQSTLPI